ncbi:MAG: hypothetical protein OXG59_02105 [Gammaproteobacteria bacterium]|nr:hypothetical protein [Gammaproteobacteria bacterium]MCY3815066.1 hypothetical protein [Gammaproteobacteria bacterium]MXZ27047.1 hypothetical protein [Gammaproteobacteria bacterium]MYF59231.1 hypothetical protein [Gammaproteobacteria bacterium]
MNDDPRSFNNPDRPTLTADDMPGVGQAVMTLTHELYVLIDRLAALEAVLERHGLNVGTEIETFKPDAEQQKQLNERGRALVARVTNALAGKSDPLP